MPPLMDGGGYTYNDQSYDRVFSNGNHSCFIGLATKFRLQASKEKRGYHRLSVLTCINAWLLSKFSASLLKFSPSSPPSPSLCQVQKLLPFRQMCLAEWIESRNVHLIQLSVAVTKPYLMSDVTPICAQTQKRMTCSRRSLFKPPSFQRNHSVGELNFRIIIISFELGCLHQK